MSLAGSDGPNKARVKSANVGAIREVAGRRPRRSAIDKRPVAGPVAVRTLGLAGDHQADRKHHGGVDQAVYAFAAEDLQAWARRLDRPLVPGQFGENLTTAGIDITQSRVGEHWRIGSTLLEVCDTRIPCRTFQQWLEEPQWVKRFTQEGRPGAYLRVLEEGELEAGDQIVVTGQGGSDLTIGVLFRALMSDSTLLPLVLQEPRVAAAARSFAQRHLESARS